VLAREHMFRIEALDFDMTGNKVRVKAKEGKVTESN
jgi:hypothetical protein